MARDDAADPGAEPMSATNGSRPRVGFIGLGHQGTPIASAIARAGFPTTVWARRPQTLADLRGGPLRIADTVAELAAASDVVGVCVLDDAAVDDVLGGTRNLLAELRPGSAVLLHSTVSPRVCLRWAAAAAERGIDLLDAPVSNAATASDEFTSAHNAAALSVGRALTVLVGGDPAAFERCRGVLESFGSTVRLLGPTGSGLYAKLLNNALVYTQLALVHSAVEAGRAAGLEPTALLDVLRTCSARSQAMDIVASHGRPLDPDRVLHDTTAQIGGLVRKDVEVLLDTADRDGLDLAVLHTVLPETVDLFSPR
jgi:3-hydroxyisobutyrate dehydrogenase